MKKQNIFLVILLSISGINTFAQSTLTEPEVQDSIILEEEAKIGFFQYNEEGNPVPKKTLTYSLILPGMGQAYNRRWWKLPFVYGAVGGLVYAIDFNQSRYRRLRDALEAELLGEVHEFTDTPIGNANSLRSNRDTYDRYTQLSYMGSILLYGVIAIEAFTDAHLQNFDISDDLSMEIKPSFRIDQIENRPTVGVSIIVRPNW